LPELHKFPVSTNKYEKGVADNINITNIVNPLGLAWWYWLGFGSVLLLKVSSSILSGANLDGLI